MEDRVKLQQYEKMQKAIQERYEDACDKLEEVKEAGRTKSATYRQYMGNKMMYKNMLDLYALYDLKEE